MRERLQKLIAAAGLASRREVERWIASGRVTVNGRPAALGDAADPAVDRIEVDGRQLAAAGKLFYVLLNKPAGYVTTARDPQGRSVVTDLVSDIPARLFPIGRLDLTTEGLLLLTNDGELANRLAHPKHQVEKTYLARVRGVLADETRRQLEKGVLLDDGLTLPARVAKVRATGSHCWFEITIREGRNRQVRRMCEAVGHSVSRLKRIRFAFLELGDLPAGSYRHLSAAEVAALKRL